MAPLGTLYKRDSAGKLRVWKVEVDGDKYRTIAGVDGGNLVTSAWTTCVGKQKRTNEEQAFAEAVAEYSKKLDREYRCTPEELDSVPPSPMLAHKYEGGVTFPVFSQPKLDGIRALISRYGAFSREYQRHLNCDHILTALAPVFEKHPNVMFDGEFYNHDFKADFGKISSIVRKQDPTPDQRHEATRLLQYHVYDLLGAGPFSERRISIGDLIGEKLGPVHRVVTHKVTDAEELDQLYGAYLEAGYEGQMVRLDANYEVDKRSKSLLKRKEFIADEFKLLRIEEGTGNWAGYAKRCVFALSDGRECGAGIRGSQEQMRILLDQSCAIRDVSSVTIRYFTPSPDGVPRFPVATDFHFGGRRD